MSKTKSDYEAVARTFEQKGDRHYAKGCAAAAAGDKSTANIEHAAAKTCYATMKDALEKAKSARS